MSDTHDAVSARGLLEERAARFGFPDVADITGPFFLGFLMEMFAMGAVLVLSIQYFLSLSTYSPFPRESSRRLGVLLVGSSLLINVVQSILDVVRGYEMFGAGFFDLAKLLRPSILWSLSPFLGIFPALVTQAFLLRRTLLFIGSLAHLWPKLAHPLVKWIFGGTLGCGIVISAIAASWSVWQLSTVGQLYDLGLGNGPSTFATTSTIWLATSSGVDIGVAIVLCFELWWARRKLARRGGGMRQVVTSLILVTLHGGLAVTSFQMSALLLYRYHPRSAWCYLPILALPKVYTITLILSLTLPQAQGSGPSPSHMFSLPTISPDRPPPHSPRVEVRRASSPDIRQYHHGNTSPIAEHCNGELKKRKRVSGDVHFDLKKTRSLPGESLKEVMRKGWRRSQKVLSWSLMGGLTNQSPTPPKKEVGKEVDEPRTPTHLYPLTRPRSAPSSSPTLCATPSDRRPSLIPLLSSPSPTSTALINRLSERRPSTLSHFTLPLTTLDSAPLSSALSAQDFPSSPASNTFSSPMDAVLLPSPVPVAYHPDESPAVQSPPFNFDRDNPFATLPRNAVGPPMAYPARHHRGEDSQASSVVSFSAMLGKSPPR